MAELTGLPSGCLRDMEANRPTAHEPACETLSLFDISILTPNSLH